MTRAVSLPALLTRPLLVAAALAAVVPLAWRLRAGGAELFDVLLTAPLAVALVAASLWLLREGLLEARDARALRSRAPEDRKPGAWVAVAGHAIALQDEFTAVLTDRPALACSYRITGRVFTPREEGRRTRRSLRLRLRYEGFHLAPTGIETDSGVVPLKALPDMVNLESSEIGAGGERLEREAELRSWWPPRYAARAQLAAQVGDRLQVDWRYDAAAYDDRRIYRKEWVLAPGTQVCVFGRWDGQALVPSPWRPRGLPIYEGAPEEVAQRLGGGSKVFLALALLPLVAAGFLLFGY